MNNRYSIIFRYRGKMRIKTYESKTRSGTLNYFHSFYELDSKTLYYSISVSEFDAHQKVEHLLALLTFIEKSINGDTVRRDWRNWSIGRVTIYETHEFDGDNITQGIITEIYSDHVILTAGDMCLWIDDDAQFTFR